MGLVTILGSVTGSLVKVALLEALVKLCPSVRAMKLKCLTLSSKS